MRISSRQCEEKCDLTKETRTTQCATQDGTVYPDDMCDADKKPELERECEKSEDCDFQWFSSQWSKVSGDKYSRPLLSCLLETVSLYSRRRRRR